MCALILIVISPDLFNMFFHFSFVFTNSFSATTGYDNDVEKKIKEINNDSPACGYFLPLFAYLMHRNKFDRIVPSINQ
jgi:hypothetical protein